MPPLVMSEIDVDRQSVILISLVSLRCADLDRGKALPVFSKAAPELFDAAIATWRKAREGE
jgi:hypothetical protein